MCEATKYPTTTTANRSTGSATRKGRGKSAYRPKNIERLIQDLRSRGNGNAGSGRLTGPRVCRLELAVCGKLHVRVVEAQTDILRVTPDGAIGIFDSDGPIIAGFLVEAVLEAELRHELHRLLNVRPGSEGCGLGRLVEHAGGPELGLEF